MRPSRAHIQNITSHLHYLSPPQPLTVERLPGWLASIHQLVVSHPHLNRIPGVLRVGVGAGGGTVAGASAGVLAQAVRRQAVLGQAVLGQAVRRHQAEVAAPK